MKLLRILRLVGDHENFPTKRIPYLLETREECSIHGYHVYHTISTAKINKELPYEHESHNCRDCYAVTVKKGMAVIGHLPKNSSCEELTITNDNEEH